MVANTGSLPGTDVVQLYVARPVASVVQPTRRLLAFARVHLLPGEQRLIRFTVPAGALAFTGRDLRRVVEPGAVELIVASSAGDDGRTVEWVLRGETAEVPSPQPFVAAELGD